MTFLSENVGVNKALIYVYRRADLEKILNRDEIRSFLLNHGYLIDDNEIVGGVNCENIILQLKKKFEKLNQFPHEIGIFLGYPIGDVKGFIEIMGAIANVQVIGKYIAMKKRQQRHFVNIKNAEIFI